MQNVTGQGDLFEGENSGRLVGLVVGMEMEQVTRVALAEIAAGSPLKGKRAAQAQIAMALARNIDRGNSKGRAIANEAMQLQAVLDALSPDGDEADTDNLPQELRELIAVFGSAPRISPAPVRDAEEL